MLPSMCSMSSLLSSNGFPSTRPLLTLRGAPTFSARRLRSREQYVVACVQSLAFQSRSAWHAPSTSRKLPRKWPNQTGLVVVDPETELDFLHDLPVELMWGVGPVTRARLAEIGVRTIGQLAKMPGYSLERLLGRAAGEKLTALAWNRDPREIRTHHRAQSAGAQSALGKK